MTEVRDGNDAVKVVADAPAVILSNPQVVSTGPDVVAEGAASAEFSQVLEAKAREVLGIDGEEFKRRWYSGDYLNDTRPAVLALDALMRTGEWQLPETRQ